MLKRVDYYKDELKQGGQVVVINDLQAVTGTIKSINNELVLELQKPLVLINKESVLIDPNAKGLRIIGVLS